jgi:IS1 family transposase
MMSLKLMNFGHIMYAYHRASGEIVAYLKNSTKIKKKLNRLGITYDRIAPDDWQSFVSTFTKTEHDIGKRYTVGIEGRPTRHRNRRVFRKTCCFSKKRLIHRKVFDAIFFYINEGRMPQHTLWITTSSKLTQTV